MQRSFKNSKPVMLPSICLRGNVTQTAIAQQLSIEKSLKKINISLSSRLAICRSSDEGFKTI